MSETLSTRLLQIIGLLYHQTDADRAEIEADLLAQRKQAWRSAIQAEIRSLGYRLAPTGPSREDLAYIRDLCRLDAQSIVNTWNRDVDRQLVKLFNANPRGNRRYYAKHMEAWTRQRAVWKTRQIATQTEYTVVAYAKERFWAMNGMRGGKHLFVGPPPVCCDCVELFKRGPVDQRFVDQNPTPRHIGCTHTWEKVKGSVATPPPEELWVGG